MAEMPSRPSVNAPPFNDGSAWRLPSPRSLAVTLSHLCTMFFEGVCELLHTQHSFRLYAVAILLMRNGSRRPLDTSRPSAEVTAEPLSSRFARVRRIRAAHRDYWLAACRPEEWR
jgi:hypothetical protein